MSWDIQHSAVELGTAMSQVRSVCVPEQVGMSWDIQHCCRARHCHVPGLQCSVCTGATRNVPGYPTLCCTTMSQVYSVLCVLGQVGISWDIPHYAALPCPRSTVSCVPRENSGWPGTSHTTLHCHVPGLQYLVCTGKVGMSWDIPHSAALPCPRSTVFCVYWDKWGCLRTSRDAPGYPTYCCTAMSQVYSVLCAPGHPTLCYPAMSQVYSVLCALGQVGMSWDIPHSAVRSVSTAMAHVLCI